MKSKIELQEPMLKNQMQQIKLTETVMIGVANYDDMKDLANKTAMMGAKVNSYLAELNENVSQEFYNEATLIFIAKQTTELEQRSKIITGAKLLEDEVNLSLTNCYEILGVEPGISEKNLNKAYRAKSIKVHPDTAKDLTPEEATKEFAKVTFAYARVSMEEIGTKPTI